MRHLTVGAVGAVFGAFLLIGGLVAPASAQNQEEGDNADRTAQRGTSTSGDSVGGQVVGAQSSGRTSIDATNRSADATVASGDAVGSNRSVSRVGHVRTPAGETSSVTTTVNICGNEIFATIIDSSTTCIIDTSLSFIAENDQVGDNRLATAQSANASSGDAVGGQVIGSVNSGTTSIVAANTSDRIDVDTGDASSANNSGAFVGLDAAGPESSTAIQTAVNFCGNAIEGTSVDNTTTCIIRLTTEVGARNDQLGDNRGTVSQSAAATTGDGVAGQVVGTVSTGTSSVDARNLSVDTSILTGDASSSNDSDLDVGLTASGPVAASISQIPLPIDLLPLPEGLLPLPPTNACGNVVGGTMTGVTTTCIVDATVSAVAANDQVGDNRASVGQLATATSGDGVGGQIIGAVTSGASAIVAQNTSRDVDVATGDAVTTNASAAQAGLAATSPSTVAAVQAVGNICGNVFGGVATGGAVTCVIRSSLAMGAGNTQAGDNNGTLDQTSRASSGDGVGGQVIGVVAAGTASVDASNASENASVETGDASASSAARLRAGLFSTSPQGVFIPVQVLLNVCGNVVVADLEATCLIGVEDDLSQRQLQAGDNRLRQFQLSDAGTGDAIAGQVTGVVVTTGGAASVVVANRSSGVDARTGSADQTADFVGFVGLLLPGGRLAG